MCKCVKDSLTHLKNNEIGRAKFSLISREWEFSELDFEKHSDKLKKIHKVEMYEGKTLEEFQAEKSQETKTALKNVQSSVKKLLGVADPFAEVVASFTPQNK